MDVCIFQYAVLDCTQGEVEQIAMMKPKGQTEHDEGMLEYLEDIIGSCRLKEPIQILARRIELLNEQRGEKVATLIHHLLREFKQTRFLWVCSFHLKRYFYFIYFGGFVCIWEYPIVISLHLKHVR